MNWSTYQDLIPEKPESTEQKTAREAFDSSVAIKCGSGEKVEDFDKLGAVETPVYDLKNMILRRVHAQNHYLKS